MKNYLLALVLLIGFSSCEKENEIKCGGQDCITNKIEAFKKSAICANGASIQTYIFLFETVYAFDPGFCIPDRTIEIYRSDCCYEGTLYGIAVNRKINGIDFFEKATYLQTIWQN